MNLNHLASLACVIFFVLSFAPNVVAQGIVLHAGGSVNRSMGGATTGTGIEAIGSMYWNPATITALESDELGIGFEVLYANQNIASSFPGVGSGRSGSETGAVPSPTIAWVHQTGNPDVKFGMGIFGTGGFSINTLGNATNPVLGPPASQGGVGVGGLKSDALFFQLAPAWALRLTDRLSMGFGPTIGLGKIAFDANAFVAPNANGAYPRGDGTRFHWGLGAQIGFHFIQDCCWEYGASIKSPVWFESFRYFSEDATGLPRVDKVDFDLPMILSGGIAYKGIEYILLTADLRYFNYAAADGFGGSANYQASGAANGLGWNDQFSMAIGSQMQLTDRLTGRLGYVYMSELFDDSATFFNFAADLSYRHVFAFGGSFQLNECVSLNASYNYLFPWDSSGPYVLPGTGSIAGSSVTTEFDAHFVTVGLNVRY